MSQPDIHSELPFLALVKALDAIYSLKQKVGKKVEEKKRYLKIYVHAFDDAKDKFISQHGKQSVSNFHRVFLYSHVNQLSLI